MSIDGGKPMERTENAAPGFGAMTSGLPEGGGLISRDIDA
ncbi:MAG: hypothetical protein JWR10_432 [Rubritepida sp.]|nr:hypothetical protein [Rubritepida sp.]